MSWKISKVTSLLYGIPISGLFVMARTGFFGQADVKSLRCHRCAAGGYLDYNKNCILFNIVHWESYAPVHFHTNIIIRSLRSFSFMNVIKP